MDVDFGVETVELSENKAEDIIEYSRGNIIRNEQQALLLTHGWLSGWFHEESNYVNQVVIGTTGGGKTHNVRKMKQLIDVGDAVYESTSSSDKGFVDDDDWEGTKVAILSEWQKLGNEVRDFMKSVAGDDGGYTYSRSVPDPDGADGDRMTKKIDKESKPYSFTYAQFSMDNEMWTRLFKVYIEESSAINRAVARMHAGHENISLDGEFDREYIYETDGLKRALQNHVRSLPEDARVEMPEWVFYAVEPCLYMSRSETKRVAAMVFNFIRCSTLLNYDEREQTEEGAYVVEPQDVANILSCREVLLGTTHELEPRKQEVVDAVRHKTRMGDESYCFVDDIQDYFESERSDMSLLKKEDLREILTELEENFVVKIHERVDGSHHGYEFKSLSQIGHPRLTGFMDFEYSDDDPFMGVGDPNDPFEDCVDPIKEIPFKESVEQFREEITENVVDEDEITASDAMGPNDSASSDTAVADGGQSTLSGGTSPSYTIEDRVEAAVYERLCEQDGAVFEDTSLEHEHVLSIVDTSVSPLEADLSGTMLDTSHDLWVRDGETIVESEGDARARVEEAYARLDDNDVVRYSLTDDDNVRVDVNTDVDVEV